MYAQKSIIKHEIMIDNNIAETNFFHLKFKKMKIKFHFVVKFVFCVDMKAY